MQSNELYHYGVKGMKWGVRKDRASGFITRARNNRTARKERKINAKRAKALDVRSSAKYTYKQRKLLSDEELRYRINRLNMEKQLKELSRNSSGPLGSFSNDVSVSTGRRAAQKALGIYGAKLAVSQIAPGAEKFVKVPK